jgi:hypothetical protein
MTVAVPSPSAESGSGRRQQPAVVVGAVIALLLPATARLPDGSVVTVLTDYPFGDNVTVSWNRSSSNQAAAAGESSAAAPLLVRVPAWVR